MSDTLQLPTPPANIETQPVSDIVGITEPAIQQLKKVLSDNPASYGIRLGVTGGGCAGLSYQMVPCDEVRDGDLVQEAAGIRFYIHPMAAAYLKGTRLDYSTALMDGGFKFINPNAASTCGCGSSFGI